MDILLINDNAVVSKLVSLSVNKIKSKMQVVEKLQEIENKNFDLIIIDDYILENINIEDIKNKTNKDIKLLLIASKDSKYADKFEFVINKPFLPTDLLELLNEIKNSLNKNLDDTLNEPLEDDLNNLDNLDADLDKPLDDNLDELSADLDKPLDDNLDNLDADLDKPLDDNLDNLDADLDKPLNDNLDELSADLDKPLDDNLDNLDADLDKPLDDNLDNLDADLDKPLDDNLDNLDADLDKPLDDNLDELSADLDKPLDDNLDNLDADLDKPLDDNLDNLDADLDKPLDDNLDELDTDSTCCSCVKNCKILYDDLENLDGDNGELNADKMIKENLNSVLDNEEVSEIGKLLETNDKIGNQEDKKIKSYDEEFANIDENDIGKLLGENFDDKKNEEEILSKNTKEMQTNNEDITIKGNSELMRQIIPLLDDKAVTKVLNTKEIKINIDFKDMK